MFIFGTLRKGDFSIGKKNKHSSLLFLLTSLFSVTISLSVSETVNAAPLKGEDSDQTYVDAYRELDPFLFELINIDPSSKTGLGHESDDDLVLDGESDHSRFRRVAGGRSVLWQLYPWLGGLEQIDRDDRYKKDFEYNTPAPKPSTASSTATTTTLPATTTDLTNNTMTVTPLTQLITTTVKSRFSATDDFECSAVLVHRYWAMTVAHCLERNISENTKKYVKLTFINPATNKLIKRTTNLYIRHPNYFDTGDKKPREFQNLQALPASMTMTNDIAFIRLRRPIDEINPVKIKWREISDSDIEKRQLKATVCGWGKIKASGDYADQLQCASLHLISGRKCNKLYNPYKEYKHVSVSDREICAADLPDYMKDACKGDSGGPLFQMHRNKKTGAKEPYVIGLVSSGDRCAKKHKPGTYTRLSSFEHFGRCFIEDNMTCDYLINFYEDKKLNKFPDFL